MKNNISKLRNCYGCGVCVPSCPTKIIELKRNSDGFYSPVVTDDEKCIECGVCLDVCAFNHSDISLKDSTPKGYAGWSNNPNVRFRCSSGGVGYELGKLCIESGMKVCSVRYDAEKRRAEHYVAATVEEFMPSVGSKYIPSYTADGFRKIDRKEKYLVTGTPCQIDSFRRYIRRFKMEDNFVLMDFFCHGVPSLLLWDSYLKEVEGSIGKSTFASWRNKSAGWHDSWAVCLDTDARACDDRESYNLLKEEKKHAYESKFTAGDLFYKFFLGNLCLNDCCYQCKYKAFNSAADIRIGDFWGKKYESDDKGTNAIVAFTPGGVKWVESLENSCTIAPESPDSAVDGQMVKPPARPKVREGVIAALKSGKSLKRIYEKNLFIYRLNGLAKRLIKKFF